MVIAEYALQQLEPKVQRKLEQQAFALVRRQEAEKRLYLMRAFPGSTAFAQLSVFADTHRSKSLHQLYTEFGSGLPSNFASYADKNTSTWHYKNQPFYSSSIQIPGAASAPQCDLSEQTDIGWAITALQGAFNDAESEQNQILALALLIHLVGDAHQPLHAISRVDNDCESDRGGNRFCVAYATNSYRCETNLHSLWDSALGFFADYDSIEQAVEFLKRVEVKDTDADNLDPDVWLSEGFGEARFVYSIKEGSGGDAYYISEGQIIAYERMALAAERLANMLEQLY